MRSELFPGAATDEVGLQTRSERGVGRVGLDRGLEQSARLGEGAARQRCLAQQRQGLRLAHPRGLAELGGDRGGLDLAAGFAAGLGQLAEGRLDLLRRSLAGDERACREGAGGEDGVRVPAPARQLAGMLIGTCPCERVAEPFGEQLRAAEGIPGRGPEPAAP
ncbi:MAG: hypothetical protein QM765_52435 [Myxococcales bacterium]